MTCHAPWWSMVLFALIAFVPSSCVPDGVDSGCLDFAAQQRVALWCGNQAARARLVVSTRYVRTVLFMPNWPCFGLSLIHI